MKQIFTLSVSLLMACTAANAQSAQIPGLKMPGVKNTGSKTTATTESRLVATMNKRFGVSAYEPTDSSHNVFSGVHGYNAMLEQWEFDNQESYTYNTGSFTLSGKTEQTFDANKRIISSLSKYQVMGVWVDGYKMTLTYNANGQAESYLAETNSGGMGLKPQMKANITWASIGKPEVVTTQDWDGSAWVNSDRTTFTYDASGNILTELSEDWSGSAWQNDTRTTNTYTNGKLASELEETYTGGAWVNNTKTTYTLNANGDWTQSLEDEWTSGAWAALVKTIYTYDANHNELSYERQSYAGGSYVPMSKTEMTYNNYHQVLTEKNLNWNAGTSQFEPTNGSMDMKSYYEEYNNSVKGANAANSTIRIYPVPASDKLNIEMKNVTSGFAAIYDMAGKVVKSFAVSGQQNKTVDVTNLAAGNYTIRIINGTQNVQQQFTIAK